MGHQTNKQKSLFRVACKRHQHHKHGQDEFKLKVPLHAVCSCLKCVLCCPALSALSLLSLTTCGALEGRDALLMRRCSDWLPGEGVRQRSHSDAEAGVPFRSLQREGASL